MPTATLREMCQAFDMTPQGVGQQVRKGIFVRLGQDAYDMVPSTRNYLARQQARTDPKLTAARAKLLAEKARMAQLERETAEGKVAPVALFFAACNRIIGDARTIALAVPSRMASQFGMVTNAVELNALAKKEIYWML